MDPTDNLNHPEFDQARHELREGIESSRAIVQQSRVLIELLECDGASLSHEDEGGIAN